MGRPYYLDYVQNDGTPGTLDIAKTPTRITMVPDAGVVIGTGVMDDATGRFTIPVEFNSVGDTEVTIVNDGDLGEGETPISQTDTFRGLPPGGSSAVSSSVGPERPTP